MWWSFVTCLANIIWIVHFTKRLSCPRCKVCGLLLPQHWFSWGWMKSLIPFTVFFREWLPIAKLWRSGLAAVTDFLSHCDMEGSSVVPNVSGTTWNVRPNLSPQPSIDLSFADGATMMDSSLDGANNSMIPVNLAVVFFSNQLLHLWGLQWLMLMFIPLGIPIWLLKGTTSLEVFKGDYLEFQTIMFLKIYYSLLFWQL